MATISRKKVKDKASKSGACIFLIGCFLFLLVIYLLIPSGGDAVTAATEQNVSDMVIHRDVTAMKQGLRSAVARKREQLAHALHTLTDGNLPGRLKQLREQHQIVGERLAEVQAGQETVYEILHGEHDKSHHQSSKPPMELNEVIHYLDSWIHRLHEEMSHHKLSTFDQIWEAYHDLTVKTLYPWDQEYLSRMPPRRDDGSIFLSVATYRDENCFNTVYNAYDKSHAPEKLFIGLTQQNCHQNCRSGVLANLSMVEVPPDEDCYARFCATDLGKPICARGQVRVLNIDEPESLGPYAARYFTSKLWFGEEWFMQTDAHMTFATNWDAISVQMLKKAPSKKPVLSHYPPSETVDLDKRAGAPASRLCGPVFATSDLESQIVRLEGAGVFDQKQLEYPGFAPFTAAGYFVAHSQFLKEVPFDPFLPWIFMGEEIIMSSRLWTAGYDIFSPTQSVVGHFYVRRHMPKFWESVHRAFTFGVSTSVVVTSNCTGCCGMFLVSASVFNDASSTLYRSTTRCKPWSWIA
jgi:[Skp1-protein]-hydroxyproline N-acetylglucosaminyltransferase